MRKEISRERKADGRIIIYYDDYTQDVIIPDYLIPQVNLEFKDINWDSVCEDLKYS